MYMSNKIIELSQFGGSVAVFLLGLLIAILVILGISGVIYSIHSRKEKRLRETKYKADSDYSKRNLEIVENEELNFDQKQAERQKAREERDDVYKEADDKIKVLDKRYNAVDSFLSAIRIGAFIIFWTVWICFIIVGGSIGGSVKDIREVKDTAKDNIAVTAYYRVDYERVEQDTLTVFVKNESDKVLDKATISEKETGASTNVYTLEPGQEKIVSIVVYPNKDGKYEFEISNVEFHQ